MKPKSALAIAVLTLAGVTAYLLVAATGQADESSAPAYVTKIPAGYRDWKVVSVAHEAGKLNSLGIVLGNDVSKNSDTCWIRRGRTGEEHQPGSFDRLRC